MTPKKKQLLRGVALLLLVCLCAFAVACKGQTGSQPTDSGSTDPAAEATYQVQVLSQGGVAVSGVSVYVYAQQSLEDLLAVGATDQQGVATLTCPAGSGYVAVLGNVPEGYQVESFYPLTGEKTEIKLSVALVEGDLSKADYALGSVMQDFTFTAADGTEYKLSQLLESKQAVVLNFFDLSSNTCKMELPQLQEAYAQYADSVAVLAMSPVARDNADISRFIAERGITFPMGMCDSQWEKAMHILTYPTTVVIDRFGMVTLLHGDAFRSATEFRDVFAFFTAQDYTQTVVENYEDLLVSEPEESLNPVDISGQSSFQLTLKPGQIHYLNLHKVQNVWMQINHSDVFVEYGPRTYTASGGSVGLMVSAISTFEPAQLGFGNSGKETVTVTVTLSHLQGSQENPYSLQLGEFSASVSAGNDQGVYFSYTAQEDGYFSLQCLGVSPSVEYTFSIMNLTTSAMRVLGEESETDPATGNAVVKMAMNKGEKISISIGALPDSANAYPAATFKMLAQFTAGDVEDVVVVEKIPYAITVTDENRQPVFGVNLTLTGTLIPETPEAGEGDQPAEPAKPDRITMSTGEDGIASGYLPKDTYTGSLMVPAGYVATTTTFELSPENPYVSLMLKTHIIETAEYTVRVIDEDGAPVPGVLITIGTTFGTTDRDGVYTVTLEKASYTAVLGVPEGYTADAISVPFPENSTVLGITLKKGGGQVTGIEYTVKAVDAGGTGLSDIVVTFLQEGEPVLMVPADEMGVAVATLAPGDYTVSLTSGSGAALKFDKTQAALSPEKTSTTVTVAADITATRLYSYWWGKYYRLPVGSSWDDLTDTANYAEDYSCFMYVFRPETSGVYRFSATGGVLGYYGGVDYPFGPGDSTAETGYFEVTVKDGEFDNNNKPTLVLGLVPNAGQTETVITLLRTADAPKELPEEDYLPVCPIQSFTYSGSTKLTYVDITGTAEIQKGADGYYYLDGKMLYMNIGRSAPYITLGEMVGIVYDSGTGTWGTSNMATGMKGLRYEGTTPVAIVDFTDCMKAYANASDPRNGLYPLNDDLIYMVKTHGEYVGWWEADSPTCLFPSPEGINMDIAWMFAVCYANSQ